MSEDPRAAHTKSALKQALMKLLEQDNWGGITIVGICHRAGVARSSFYEHYGTKSDLLDEVFSDNMAKIRPSTNPNGALATLDWLIDHVAEAPEFFAHAMQGGRGDALLPRFREALIQRLSEELAARSISDARVKAAYVVGGSMAYLAENDTGATREFIQELARRLIR